MFLRARMCFLFHQVGSWITEFHNGTIWGRFDHLRGKNKIKKKILSRRRLEVSSIWRQTQASVCLAYRCIPLRYGTAEERGQLDSLHRAQTAHSRDRLTIGTTEHVARFGFRSRPVPFDFAPLFSVLS